MLLFKKILDFKKSEGGVSDKRGAKRYAVGVKFAIKAKLSLPARDSEGGLLTGSRASSTDWGGQLVDLSYHGASMRLHPAASAAAGDTCQLKLELDHKLFEIDARIAHFRVGAQHVTCGLTLQFADGYARKAFLQLMEPVVIGGTLEPVSRVKQDIPGLLKEQYRGESESELNVWRDSGGRNPKLFELLVHGYAVRGNTEMPGLKVSYRDGTTTAMGAGHKDEIRRLFLFITQNLNKSVPAEIRKFLELFAV
ncbi:MAG: PilZ protein [Verrucomicrobiota bacterium]|nr:PilZ protein [Verrucomicrobiota bacterium]